MPKLLTAAAVERLRPGRKRREVRDGGAPGLHLLIQVSGAKSWALRFRRPDGRPAKLTLGPLDVSRKEPEGEPVPGTPLSLVSARALAAEMHRQRAAGRDVAAHYITQKRQRASGDKDAAKNTFGALARRFVDEHARPRTRRWRDTARMLGFAYPTDDGEPTLIRAGLADRWHDKPIAEIDPGDIYSLIDEARRVGVPGLERHKEGASDTRGLAMARCASKLFAWLVEHRRITTNPCLGMHRPPAPPARHRVLTESEIRWFWAACDQVAEPFGVLLKLLLITGARRQEVAGMTHGELSEDLATWSLPGSRTKNKRPHVVPLSPLARDLIANIPKIEAKLGYIFTTNGATPVSGFSKIKVRLDRLMPNAAREEAKAAGRDPGGVSIPSWRLHDLRRTCATGMVELGVQPHVVETVLNHVSGHRAGVAGVYNKSVLLPERKAALERWAAHVKGIVAGEPANVVSGQAEP